MLHMGTLLALLVYFWRDWMTLIPAGLASIPRPFVRRRPRPQAGLAAGRRDHSRGPRRAAADRQIESWSASRLRSL
jgi:hypothetical protein